MDPQQYFPIPLKGIVVDSIPDFDIYIRQKDTFVLYRKNNLRFETTHLEKLIDSRVATLYLRKEDHPRYENYRSRAAEAQEYGPGFAPHLFDDPAEVRQYHLIQASYLPVDRKLFVPGSEIDFPLFSLAGNRLSLLPEMEADKSGPWQLGNSIAEGRAALLIRNEDTALYREYLECLFFADREISSSSPLSTLQKASVLRDTTKIMVRDLLEDPKSGEKMKALVEVAEELVDFIFTNQAAVSSLLMIGSHDFLTYQHSVNVSFLCTGVGAELGLFRDDLLNLALGGLLHDIGKSAIDTDVLNKPGLLDEDETRLVHEHVNKGVALLWEHEGIPEQVIKMISQHHERLNGEGYPERLKGDQMTQAGKVLAVVEVYDAMTTERPYKRAARRADALEYLESAADQFDREVTEKLKALVDGNLK